MTDKRLWELIRYQIEGGIPSPNPEEIKSKALDIIEGIKSLLVREGYILTTYAYKSKKIK